MWAKIFVPVISRMTMTRLDFGQGWVKVCQWVNQKVAGTGENNAVYRW